MFLAWSACSRRHQRRPLHAQVRVGDEVDRNLFQPVVVRAAGEEVRPQVGFLEQVVHHARLHDAAGEVDPGLRFRDERQVAQVLSQQGSERLHEERAEQVVLLDGPLGQERSDGGLGRTARFEALAAIPAWQLVAAVHQRVVEPEDVRERTPDQFLDGEESQAVPLERQEEVHQQLTQRLPAGVSTFRINEGAVGQFLRVADTTADGYNRLGGAGDGSPGVERLDGGGPEPGRLDDHVVDDDDREAELLSQRFRVELGPAGSVGQLDTVLLDVAGRADYEYLRSAEARDDVADCVFH